MLGKVLRIYREASGLTQKELALELGYESPQFISDWEREKSQPPMNKVIQLARLLKVDDSELVRWMIEDAKQQVEATLTRNYDRERSRKKA